LLVLMIRWLFTEATKCWKKGVYNKLKKYLQGAIILLRLMLYQGQQFESKSLLRIPLHLWSFCFLLISYFYLGDNISDLTSPKRVVRYDRMDELFHRNFTFNIQFAHSQYVRHSIRRLKTIEDLETLAYYHRCLDLFWPKFCEFKFITIFFTIVTELKQFELGDMWHQNKVWQDSKKIVNVSQVELNEHDLVKLIMKEGCRKRALVDWSDWLDEVEQKLWFVLSSEKIVTRGRHQDDQLLSGWMGWAFRYWGDDWILRRFKGVWEAGFVEYCRALQSNAGMFKIRKQAKEYDEIDQVFPNSEESGVSNKISLDSNCRE